MLRNSSDCGKLDLSQCAHLGYVVSVMYMCVNDVLCMAVSRGECPRQISLGTIKFTLTLTLDIQQAASVTS